MAEKTFAGLLDNLWLWGSIAMGVMLVYGVWALLEIISMHGLNVQPHPP